MFRRLIALSLALLPQLALASVTLYHGSSVSRLPSDFALGDAATKGDTAEINKGTAAQQFLSYVRENKEALGLKKVDGETLPFVNATQTEDGITLRFRQRHDRVEVDGAELIGIFDANGELQAINTSAVGNLSLSVTPELSREAARAAVLASQGYESPEIRDLGLSIVREANGSPALVWKHQAWESQTGEKFFTFETYASGPRKGTIRRMLNAVHAAKAPKVKIYDAPLKIGIPTPLYRGVHVSTDGKDTLFGKLFRKNAPAEAVQSADEAYVSIKKVVDYYKNVFNRNSYDGEGAVIRASVNVKRKGIIDIMGLKQNAAWMGPFKQFAFGAGGESLGDFTRALDVVGHEFTHAVIESTSNLKYEGQSGALNEHLADVFGAVIENEYEHGSRPFLIGDTVLRGELAQKAKALRDMERPNLGVDWQPEHVSQIPSDLGTGCVASAGNDNCGVHILSGVPNRMSALVIRALGWEKSAKLFYRVMTARLRADSDFADYSNQLQGECQATLSAAECLAVRGALKVVGMN